MNKRLTLKVLGFLVGSVYLTTNPYGKGWMLYLHLGKGSGYRWIDFPGYINSIHAPWYRHLSISGRTLQVGSRVKKSASYGQYNADRWGWCVGTATAPFTRPLVRLYVTGLSKRCNRSVFPGWW